MNIAILGAGFIGKNLVSSYLKSGGNVSVLDRNTCPDEFKNKLKWVQGSFENSDDILDVISGVDVVFHLISSTVPCDAVDENEEIMNNVSQTINLLKLCVESSVKRIVFVSSSSVYGAAEKLPIHEKDETNPISSHGIHKLTIEKYLQLYKYKHGLDCKIMRLSNPYGRGQKIYGRQGIVAIAIGKILKSEPIQIMGDGNAVRDFIHMDDVVNACHLLGETKSDEIVFNIGSGSGLSINEVLNEFQSVANSPFEIKHVGSRGNDINKSTLDVSKAKDILGFQAGTPFNIGLRTTLKQYANDYPEINNTFDTGEPKV